MMFSHCTLLRAASHKFPGFLYKRLKLLIKVKRWTLLECFLVILPLRTGSPNFLSVGRIRNYT